MGWALDEDLRLAKQALQDTVEFTELAEADVVHSVWWEGLLKIPQAQLSGKHIICCMQNDLFGHELTDPRFRRIRPMVGLWFTRGAQGYQDLSSANMNSIIVPYMIDQTTFHPPLADEAQRNALHQQWDIPVGKYLIGSFQRDTEGRDLVSPKLHKGPDIFLEIITQLAERGHPIHVLLAGPRRHWLRSHLQERGISFTFIGEIMATDDIKVNVLPRTMLNLLYGLIDLYLIASRYEGGPQAILEAAATRCKIISTPVGMAEDVLEQDSIFRTPNEAACLVEADIMFNRLAPAVELQYQRVCTNHSISSIGATLRKIYANIESIPSYQYASSNVESTNRQQWRDNRFVRRFLPSIYQPRVTVGLWHEFVKPPYGGGNQFMMALRGEFQKQSILVRENKFQSGIDAYLLNSAWFDTKQFFTFSQRHRMRVVHRIDGPIQLYRGKDRDQDDLVYEFNARFAFATVLQSKWTYQQTIELGYKPVNPVIIYNAVDPGIFHSKGRIPYDTGRKIRLISTSWSDNPRKGGPIYHWIEKNLDWNRFEYTFVGRASERFERIHHIPPVSSEELATLLREHDIYITASQNDPCSNALIEAMACGLPALYLNSGGHPEIVGYGGLPFTGVDEIFSQLDTLVENYSMFQNLIRIPGLNEVADKYLALLQEAACSTV